MHQAVPGSWSPGPGLHSSPVGLPVSGPWPEPWCLTAHRSPQGLQNTHLPPAGTWRPNKHIIKITQKQEQLNTANSTMPYSWVLMATMCNINTPELLGTLSLPLVVTLPGQFPLKNF